MADLVWKFEFEEKASPSTGTAAPRGRAQGSAPWDQPNAAGHLGARWADPRPPRRTSAAEVKQAEDIRAPRTRLAPVGRAATTRTTTSASESRGLAPVGRAATTRTTTSASESRGLATAGNALTTRLTAQATGSLGGTASGALAALGPVGIAIGAVALGLGLVAKAASAVVAKFKEMSNTLAPFSASVTLAQVQNEIAQTVQNVRRAQTLGPQLGQFTSETGRIDRAMQRIGDAILQPILDVTVPLLDRIADAVEVVAEHGDEIMAGVKAAAFAAAPIPAGLLAINARMAKAEQQREREQIGNIQRQFRDLPTLENEVLDGRKADDKDLAPLQIGAVL